MSGIGAIFSLRGPAVGRSEVERMRNALKPLGPDGQRIVVRGNAAFVGCLHRVTPEDALEQQPLDAPGYLMVFDGRLDNREELGGWLGLATGELPFTPDGKLVALAWQKWHDGAFERMVGAFAIVIADLRSDEFLCVRDQLGLRALYYHHTPDHFAVASSPEALLALSWVPRQLNEEMVAAALVQRGADPEETYYRGVSRLPMGTILRVRSPGISKKGFWHPEALPDIRFRRDDEYVAAFRELLERSVAANVRSAHAPCSEITGGLNSSSISVIAADIVAAQGRKLDAYSAVPGPSFSRGDTRYRYFDETPYVRAIAELNGNISPHFVQPSQTPLIDQIAELTRVVGEPASVLNGLWGMDIMRAARAAGHNVLLSGQMGNETMSYGGNSLAAELLVSGRWLRLGIEIARSKIRRERMIRREVILPFVPRSILLAYKLWRRRGEAAWRSFSSVDAGLARTAQIDTRAARYDRGFDTPPIRDGRADRIFALRRANGCADWHTRMRAAFGIDIRNPALDRRLVEFCLGVPEEQFLHYGERRWLMRRAMVGRLPASVLANHKIGSQAADWFPRLSRELPNLRREIDRVSVVSRVRDMVDPTVMLEIVDSWPEGEPPQASEQADRMAVALPDGLSAALFIEAFERKNAIAGANS